MKKTALISLLCAVACSTAALAQNNTLTKKEKNEGWTLLFDGKSFDGWRQYNATGISDRWIIDDGAIKICQDEENAKHGRNIDILYDRKKYSNFELSVDWKISKGGNSGIFYYVVETPGKPIFYSAPEIQILDNATAKDNQRKDHLAGSLYDMLPADPQSVKPAGEWNNIVIRVKDGKVTHTQNGIKVVEYTLWTPEWYDMVAKSKFKDSPGFNAGPAKEGYIGLQDHGNDCWFRNIKIREL